MINRRTAMTLGSAAAFSFATGCSTQKADSRMPDLRLSDYHMPVEGLPHVRTFMQWPVLAEAYGKRNLVAIQKTIAKIANTISEYEPVVLLASKKDITFSSNLLSSNVEIWDIPTDDLWCRDSGPTFVVNNEGQTAVAHIHFNGWGNKQKHSNDQHIAASVAKALSFPLLETGLTGEQGGVEHDGDGLLLAHASCWVNPNRNRMSQEEIGSRLCTALGGETMIWAPGIIGADITDYHIDSLARFVAPGTVLIQIDDAIDPSDPWSKAAHETLAILQNYRNKNGKALEIIKIPNPTSIRVKSKDFVSSYINYYMCNNAIIAPEFGDKAVDDLVFDKFTDLFPNREIIMLNIDPLGESGGGIHCATQQQPAPH